LVLDEEIKKTLPFHPSSQSGSSQDNHHVRNLNVTIFFLSAYRLSQPDKSYRPTSPPTLTEKAVGSVMRSVKAIKGQLDEIWALSCIRDTTFFADTFPTSSLGSRVL